MFASNNGAYQSFPKVNLVPDFVTITALAIPPSQLKKFHRCSHLANLYSYSQMIFFSGNLTSLSQTYAGIHKIRGHDEAVATPSSVKAPSLLLQVQ
jgi:hypothetical protein